MLITLASMAAACSDYPGLFFRVRLQQPSSTTVCMDLAGELTSKLSLHVVYTGVRRGQCLVTLGDREHPNGVLTISSYPKEPVFAIHVEEFARVSSPSAATRELAERVVSITQEKFPGATIVPFTSKRSLIGP